MKEIIYRIAKSIAASEYPYSGPALVCLPNGKQITREEYWNSLSENKKEEYIQYAYAAYKEIGNIGVTLVMVEATKEYFEEK